MINMTELLENNLLNVLNNLEQVDKDRLWVDTHNKVNHLANAIGLALEQLQDNIIEYEGYMIAIYNAKKTLEGACTQ